MWHWLLDHWWVATTVPYLSFNYFILWAYQKDEGPIDFRELDEVSSWAIIMIAGLPLCAVYAMAIIGNAFWCGFREGLAEATEGVRLDWRLFAARACLWLALVIVAVVLYAFSLATTGYYPGPFEYYGMLAVVTFGAWWLSKKILTRKGRPT